jgi:hypothetical protein
MSLCRTFSKQMEGSFVISTRVFLQTEYVNKIVFRILRCLSMVSCKVAMNIMMLVLLLRYFEPSMVR